MVALRTDWCQNKYLRDIFDTRKLAIICHAIRRLLYSMKIISIDLGLGDENVLFFNLHRPKKKKIVNNYLPT